MAEFHSSLSGSIDKPDASSDESDRKEDNSSSSSSSSESGSSGDESGGSDSESNNENNVTLKPHPPPPPSSNSGSESETNQTKSPPVKARNKKEVNKFWEDNPDIYGIRRSNRSRKEPNRYRNSEESDNDSDNGSKNNSSSQSSNSSEDEAPHRPVQKKKKPRRKSSYSDEEYSDSDSNAHRNLRDTKSKVSYKEQSADETGPEDVMECDEELEPMEVVDNSSETIEKVLEHRMGKKGAIGANTTVYAIESHGDPNDPTVKELELQYLIKWTGWAYIHSTWETEASLKEQKVQGMKKLDNYIKAQRQKRRYETPEEAEDAEIKNELYADLLKKHYHVERIINHRKGDHGGTDYFCKWEGLYYNDSTWEADHLVSRHFQHEIEDYFVRTKSQKIPNKASKSLKQRPKFIPFTTQPIYIGGEEKFELRDYQLSGLNWLASSWSKDYSTILADEMGLGKTIQTISFLSYLYHEFEFYGPFLIVVPLSTLAAWQSEFKKWAPELNVVAYYGSVASREIIRKFEWCHPGNKRLKFNVLIVTYELILKDKSYLSALEWAVLAVDEAHRLKNENSHLYKHLIDFKSHYRLLITGTPLQNSLKELWALLHFIMPQKFDRWEEFEYDHKDSAEKGYGKLHKQLEPFLLRRVKKDVEKSLPAKVERILRVDMTKLQRQYYKWILTKNYQELSKGQSSQMRFANIIMELKKCCNHASLIRLPDKISPDFLQELIRGSGKLLLLDKLLCKLKETGHRVLIFSQMVRMLDILAEYLQLRRFPFQRLDGTIKGEVRKQALEHFNADNSPDFCFLLSTRAGGLGINLATADTVVIFDSDWNPQNDLQAQARAHRIGQKNQVNIYRLVTKNSVEEDILERAKNKMVLDHLVIQRMEQKKHLTESSGPSNKIIFNKEELSSILKFGAEELFKENDDEEEPQVDIDEILSRAETREEAPMTASDELLSSFKVASFVFDEEEEMGTMQNKDGKNDKKWDDIIPLEERLKYEQEKYAEDTKDIGPRRSRKAVGKFGRNSDSEDTGRKRKRDSGSEVDLSEEEEKPRKRGRPRLNPKDAVKGFNDAEVRKFIRSYKKFPNPLNRLKSIAYDADLHDKEESDLRKLAEQLHANCISMINKPKSEQNQDGHSNKKRDCGPKFKLSGILVNVKSLLAAERELEPLAIMVPDDPEKRTSWSLSIPVKDVHWDVPWDIKDDSALLKGIYEYGNGNWEAIKMDENLGLTDKILPDTSQRPQIKHLNSRSEYLLKVLRKHLDNPKLGGHSDAMKKARKSKLEKIAKSKGEKKTHLSKAIIENDDSNDSDTNLSSKSKSHKEKTIKTEDDGHGEPEKKKEKDKSEKKSKKAKGESKDKKRISPPIMHYTANSEPRIIEGTKELDSHTFKECKELLRPIKKALRQLDNPNSTLSHEDQLRNTRQCLLKIGEQISHVLSQKKDPDEIKRYRSNLWSFVSLFTEYDTEKLYKLYLYAVKKAKKEVKPSTKDKEIKKEKNADENTKNESSPSSKKRPNPDNNVSNPKRPPYDRPKDNYHDSNSHQRSDRNSHSNSPNNSNSYSAQPPHRNYSHQNSSWSGGTAGSGFTKQERYSNDYKRDHHYNSNRPYQRDESSYKRDKSHGGQRHEDRNRYHHHNNYPSSSSSQYNNSNNNSQYSRNSNYSQQDSYNSPYPQQSDSWRRKNNPENNTTTTTNNNSSNNSNNYQRPF